MNSPLDYYQNIELSPDAPRPGEPAVTSVSGDQVVAEMGDSSLTRAAVHEAVHEAVTDAVQAAVTGAVAAAVAAAVSSVSTDPQEAEIRFRQKYLGLGPADAAKNAQPLPDPDAPLVEVPRLVTDAVGTVVLQPTAEAEDDSAKAEATYLEDFWEEPADSASDLPDVTDLEATEQGSPAAQDEEPVSEDTVPVSIDAADSAEAVAVEFSATDLEIEFEAVESEQIAAEQAEAEQTASELAEAEASEQVEAEEIELGLTETEQAEPAGTARVEPEAEEAEQVEPEQADADEVQPVASEPDESVAVEPVEPEHAEPAEVGQPEVSYPKEETVAVAPVVEQISETAPAPAVAPATAVEPEAVVEPAAVIPAAPSVPPAQEGVQELRPAASSAANPKEPQLRDPSPEQLLRDEKTIQFVGFLVGTQMYAVPSIMIREVIRQQPMSRLPVDTRFVPGVINLRGLVIPLVSLRELLQAGPAEDGSHDQFCIITGSGNLCVGLAVDRIRSMYVIRQEDIVWNVSGLLGLDDETIIGLFELEEKLVPILSVERVAATLLEEGLDLDGLS